MIFREKPSLSLRLRVFIRELFTSYVPETISAPHHPQVIWDSSLFHCCSIAIQEWYYL